MSHSQDDSAEQLSAFMDGELTDAEARFLLRRLEHDAALRAAWTRMQLASACMRGQAWQAMDAGLAERVAAGIASSAPSGSRGPLLRWAVAASVLALALVLAPRLLQDKGAPEATIAEVSAPALDHMVPSPASADLVALRAPARAAVVPTATNPARSGPMVATVERSERASPLPLSAKPAESPSDFPLVDNGSERRWPRSELVGASSDPAIEAYLVRHNQMLDEDGLGGFVPYVDVVANGRPATSPDADSNAVDADDAQ
ncbi:MAG: sigma-E factor negative regulatory protein [Arenimonas sp.]